MTLVLVLSFFIFCLGTSGCSQTYKASSKSNDDSYRWWPLQQPPKGVVAAVIDEDNKETEAMLVQSLAGLTAQAVNEGKLDEMIWVGTGSSDYNKWYQRTKTRIGFEERGSFGPWELVSRYQKKGVVKGYILYSKDTTHYGRRTTEVPNRDQSVNVATTLSGLMQGVIVEQGQEAKAKEFGLNKLADTRGKTLQWCFNEYKSRLNRHLLVNESPRTADSRDMIIAHKAMAVYGNDAAVKEIVNWLEPPSPISGWFYINEGDYVKMLSKFGQFMNPGKVTNLTVLGAGSHNYQPKKVKPLDPSTIDWMNTRHATGFLMTDGDNFGWLMSDFCFNKSYWANPHHGEFPFGWTIAVGQLSQACPDMIDFFAETKPANVSIVEQSGGYWYPDLFAIDRPDRKEILAKHARQIAHYMRQEGVTVFSFICMDVNSEGAKEAYSIFVREMDGLVGMIAIQYAPYNGGHGKTMWFKNKDGIEIPVVTPTFALWKNADWEGGGTPAQIAQWVNQKAVAAEKQGKNSFSLTSVHCWSYFTNETAGDPNSQNTEGENGQRGVTPVKWCIEQIKPKTMVVSPEELIWRIRMDHNPAQTKRAIAAFKGN